MGESVKKLLKLAKECLSIVEDSTLKDKELTMLIESSISDLKRLDIDVEKKIDDIWEVQRCQILKYLEVR